MDLPQAAYYQWSPPNTRCQIPNLIMVVKKTSDTVRFFDHNHYRLFFSEHYYDKRYILGFTLKIPLIAADISG